MLLNRTVAPTTTIVGLADAKDHLRVTDATEDFYIGTLLSAADATLEEMTGRAILPQTWAMSVDSVSGTLALPKVPVTAISSIAYYDANNAAQIATIDDFYLFKDDDRAWLEPKPGMSWPTLYARADALTVTFTAGYAAIPSTLKHAALLLVSQWFEHRGMTGDGREVPFAVTHLVGLHRTGWVCA